MYVWERYSIRRGGEGIPRGITAIPENNSRFITAIVRTYIIFLSMLAMHPPREIFVTVGIFRKNTSKYAKLMVELYICDNLNQIY